MAYTISDLYVMQDNKCLIPLGTVLDNEMHAFVSDINTTTPLTGVFNSATEGITMYKVRGNTDTSIYPVVVPVDSQSSNAAIVTLIIARGAGMFIFEYEGAIYICHAYAARGGVSVGAWYQITTTAVT